MDVAHSSDATHCYVPCIRMGDNTKAAIIRIGLMEMRAFCRQFYDGVKDETFFESCGVADLITTCYGGRNRKGIYACSRAIWARSAFLLFIRLQHAPHGLVAEAHVLTGKPFPQLEQELLNGQKLQGTLTAKEVHDILSQQDLTGKFPLFTTVYRVVYEGLTPRAICEL